MYPGRFQSGPLFFQCSDFFSELEHIYVKFCVKFSVYQIQARLIAMVGKHYNIGLCILQRLTHGITSHTCVHPALYKHFNKEKKRLVKSRTFVYPLY